MVREIINVCIGQAGIQLGTTLWEQYCTEHNILPDGTKIKIPKYRKQGPTNIET